MPVVFLEKIAFISAADAVGAVLGFFCGGVITVNGVPMYVPPGPSCIGPSAAVVSFIATKACGW